MSSKPAKTTLWQFAGAVVVGAIALVTSAVATDSIRVATQAEWPCDASIQRCLSTGCGSVGTDLFFPCCNTTTTGCCQRECQKILCFDNGGCQIPENERAHLADAYPGSIDESLPYCWQGNLCEHTE